MDEIITLQTANPTYHVNINSPFGRFVAGQQIDLHFSIVDTSGQQVLRLETVHEKLLHLLIVSRDLAWFAHEHPVFGEDGTFQWSYTFPEAGDLILFFDFTPTGADQQVVRVPITVEGNAVRNRMLIVDADKPKTINGYSVSLETDGLPNVRGTTRFTYTLTKEGQPVGDLQQYLGALGHLVIFSSDLNEFVHAHPMEDSPEKTGHTDHNGHADHNPAHRHHHHVSPLTGGPTVEFLADFRVPGMYKSWAQFQLPGEKGDRDDRILTVPMTFEVYE